MRKIFVIFSGCIFALTACKEPPPVPAPTPEAPPAIDAPVSPPTTPSPTVLAPPPKGALVYHRQ